MPVTVTIKVENFEISEILTEVLDQSEKRAEHSEYEDETEEE